MEQTVLEMIGIKKSFSGIYALSGIDFSLELGEVHALLGENGAGKSTLIKVLGGIYQPDSGIIKVNGKEVKINGVPAARENGIGIIHQEIVLVPYLFGGTEPVSRKRDKDKTWNIGLCRDEQKGRGDDIIPRREYKSRYDSRESDHRTAADGGDRQGGLIQR